MRLGGVLLLAFSIPIWSQGTSTGSAKTSGPCSPAVTGSNNTIIFKDCGFSPSSPTPSDAFAVQPEVEFISPPSGFTGFFVGYKTNKGFYELTPITTLVYVRVTNLLPRKTIIQRFQASLGGGCASGEPVDTMMGQQVFTTSFWNLTPGKTLVFPSEGTQRGFRLVEMKNVNFSHLGLINLPLLYNVLSDRYIESHESVGGWLPFSSRCLGLSINFKIGDVTGKTFPYQENVGSNEMKPNDLSKTRTMTLLGWVDLSGVDIKEIQ
jgi:hypothetical protein